MPSRVQQVLEALPDAHVSGGGWEARCPAHEDRSPSLVISISEDGYHPVVWCHGGCAYADVRAALIGRGVPETALRPAGPGQRPSAPAHRPTAAAPRSPKDTKRRPYDEEWEWDLTDERLTKLAAERRGLSVGSLIQAELGWDSEMQRWTLPVRDLRTGAVVGYRRSKWADKKRRHGWAHPAGGKARLFAPQRLREGPVLLCEGEWDALMAWQHGFNAVATTGGADKMPDVELLEPLRGRTVFIAFDCDDAGRKGAEKAAARLVGLGCQVRVVDLQLDKGGDVSDVLLRSAGSLRELMDEAPPWTGTAEVAPAAATAERFALISAQGLAQPVPPMRWLVKGIWPEKSYGVLAGEKKTLKTYNLLHMAAAVASGTRMFGQFAVPTAQPVLYLLGEGGSGPTRARLQRIAQAMGVDLTELPVALLYGAASADSPPWRDAVAAALDAVQPGVVMLDPLYAFHPQGVEAQNLYARGQMLAELQEWLAKDAALVVADHFRKTASGGGLDLDFIAQSGMAQWADSWVLQKHRQPPEVAEGNFFLRVEFGSRQWGGRAWDIDWRLGAFDEEQGEHEGDVSWYVQPANGNSSASGDTGGARDATDDLLAALRDHPEGLTRTDLRGRLRGRNEARDEAIDAAIGRGWVKSVKVEATDAAGRKTTKPVLTVDMDAIAGTTRV